MRPLDAVRAGYDEVTHLNFIMMQAMPQDVVDHSNTAARFEGPAKYAKDVDLNSPAMKAFVAELKQRGTYVDPTLVIFETSFLPEGGTPLAAYAPYMGIISPVLDRSFKAAGYPLVAGYTRADYAKSYAKMVDLLAALHRAGIPIVAGTDGWGIEIVRELELYETAGFTKAEALQSATIVPARHGRRRQAYRVDRGRQGSRFDVGRRGCLEGTRRAAPGHHRGQRRLRHGRRRAAQGGRI